MEASKIYVIRNWQTILGCGEPVLTKISQRLYLNTDVYPLDLKRGSFEYVCRGTKPDGAVVRK